MPPSLESFSFARLSPPPGSKLSVGITVSYSFLWPWRRHLTHAQHTVVEWRLHTVINKILVVIHTQGELYCVTNTMV